jgi:phenylpropionate dioxygenase-like ring-hydroxylating dioxygenase large terminal subunit
MSMSTTVESSLRHAAAADLDLGRLVEAERVHRRAFVDPDVFELEMDRIFGRSWIYVGHESQVPKAGDYFTTHVGRQPVVMTRDADGKIHVLENRCPHKGALVCPERSGHTKRLVCMYHGWTFEGDGSLAAVPVRAGYDNTCFNPGDKAQGMKRLPRVENYRGFIFASLVADGPDLATWAGEGMRGFDSVVDRAPEGRIEVIGDCFRTVQNSNWKIFIDNMSDGMHTSFVHYQTARAAKRTLEKFKIEHPGGLQVATLLAGEPDQMAKTDLVAHPNGHFDMAAFAPEPKGPDAEKYKADMIARHGEAGAQAILGRNFHNAMLFPTALMQPSLQQLRVIRPLAVDKTLLEIWVFRLKGAPDSFTSRAITAANIGNSPSNLVAADDFEAYYRVHAGLKGPESEWVLLSREANRDIPVGSSLKGSSGNSEVCMRNMYQAWSRYMSAR